MWTEYCGMREEWGRERGRRERGREGGREEFVSYECETFTERFFCCWTEMWVNLLWNGKKETRGEREREGERKREKEVERGREGEREGGREEFVYL